MDTMSLNARLRELRKTLGYTQEKMGEICGIKKSAYSMIENGHSHLSDRNKQVLIETLFINESWLEEGTGEMFRSKRAMFENSDRIRAARKEVRMVPVFGMDTVGRQLSPKESIGYIQKYIPFMCADTNDLAAIVAGNNMAPSFPAGAIVLLSKVEDWHTFIEFGQVYVIVLKDGRRLLREIRSHKDNKKVELHSRNKAYEPGVLPLKLVSDIFLVKAVYCQMSD